MKIVNRVFNIFGLLLLFFQVILIISFNSISVSPLKNRKPTNFRNIQNMASYMNFEISGYNGRNGKYPAKLNHILPMKTKMWGVRKDSIPINPITGKTDWLVTNRSNLENGKWFTQEEFSKIDIDKKGIYFVAPNLPEMERVTRKFLYKWLIFISIILVILLYINRKLRLIYYSKKEKIIENK